MQNPTAIKSFDEEPILPPAILGFCNPQYESLSERFREHLDMINVVQRHQNLQGTHVFTDQESGISISYRIEHIGDIDEWHKQNPDRFHCTNGDKSVSISLTAAKILGWSRT